jgi:hypothetical protein
MPLSPGKPLDKPTRASAEPRLGLDLSNVRVHTDTRADETARAHDARALTVGKHIVFARGAWAPDTAEGSRVLMHELAHVAQNRLSVATDGISRPGDASEVEADRIASGSAVRPRAQPAAAIQRQPAQPAQTAQPALPPLADYAHEPRLELVKEVSNEVELFRKAQLLIPWIRARDAKPFTRNEMFADPAAIAALNPKPKSADELDPLIELLVLHRVLERNKNQLKPVQHWVPLPKEEADYHGPSHRSAGYYDLDDRAYNKALGKTEKLEKEMKEKAPEVGLTGDARKTANQDAKRKELVATGVVPRDWNPKAPLDANRSFALSVKALLERLRARNDGWFVLNYPTHDYREFSADIFLKGGPTKQPGFYGTGEALRFFDDLNAAATDTTDNPYGVMAWRAIYNDQDVVAKVNAKLGADRIISTPDNEHGPGAKLHIHLDLRPADLSAEKRVGYSVMPGGRIRVD